MIRVIRAAAGACARGMAEPCLKFANAIRKDRAVLHRERPKKLDAALCNCLLFVGDAKQDARPFENFVKFSSTKLPA
jgi:hypothetical protein